MEITLIHNKIVLSIETHDHKRASKLLLLDLLWTERDNSNTNHNAFMYIINITVEIVRPGIY